MDHHHLSRRAVLSATGAAALVKGQQSSRIPIRMGVVARVRRGEDPERSIAYVRELGFPTCQIGFATLSKEVSLPLRRALDKHRVEATAVMELGPGRMVWNFYEGPLTIGLVPKATRQARIDALKLAADVAEGANVPAIHTHCGFLPENPNDSDYKEGIAAIKEVAAYCKARGRMFLFETGQETPVTLLRAIHDIGLDNVGINLDMANLILYGNGNPVDAMDVFGSFVRGTHAKDGLFPTDPRNLGREVAIGKGKVDFRKVIEKLKAVNYSGPLTIEREISGPEQKKDILDSKAYLERLLADVYRS
ncbi:MAG TPA: sugar phosphate isomerase/epimerase family protein [Bryobacteraceae bacterium]